MDENKTDNKFKIIEFPKQDDPAELPKELLEKLEMIIVKVKEKKLTSIVLYTEWEADEKEENSGGLMLWNKDGNVKEMVADTSALHAIALGGMLGDVE